MDARQRQDLDNYITGHYGEDDPGNIEINSAHEEYVGRWLMDTYCYDPAEDGPEVEIIRLVNGLGWR